MRYEKVSTMIVEDKEKRIKAMKMLDDAGCVYFVEDMPADGSSKITVLEKAEPDKLNITTAIELIAAYNKAVVDNQANIPEELLNKIRNLDIVEIAETMRRASLSIVNAIRKLNLFTLCKANGIPMNNPDSLDDGVKVSADDYHLLTEAHSCVNEIISLITSDSEMLSTYKKLLTDPDDIAQFSEGKVDKFSLMRHAKDIIYNRMLDMYTAIENEKNNLKLFCTALVQDDTWRRYAENYSIRSNLPCSDVATIAGNLSDWVNISAFFQWVAPALNQAEKSSNGDVIDELWLNEDTQKAIKDFLKKDIPDLDDYTYKNIKKLFVSSNHRMSRFVDYMLTRDSHTD